MHNPQDDKRRLIEYLYRMAVDPGHYDELMACWEQVLDNAISSDSEVFSDEELERHVSQASQILERLEASSKPPPPLSQAIMIDPNPAMLMAEGGNIIASNESACHRLGVQVGDDVASVEYEDGAAEALLAMLVAQRSPLSERRASFLGLLKVKTRNGEALLLAVCAVRCPEMPEAAALLTTMAPVWSPLLAHELRRLFGLSSAETDLIRGLVQGLSLSDIARTRCRSIHTVRTQMKSILRKTQLDSQLELVRLVGFMGRFENERGGERPAPRHDQRRTADADRCGSLRLGNGLSMEYLQIGPADGRPALFVHGMLDFLAFTAEARDYLHVRRIRLVVPVRPAFGGSDPDPGGEAEAPQRFAGYAEELLDHLDIEHAVAFGHMAGSVYAFAAAARLGERITGVLNVAGGVPILSRRQLTAMAPRQRLIALTTVHAPHLLPLFLKAGIALIRNGGENAFLNALYRGCPVDHEVAMRPEVRSLLNEGYHFAIAQGQQAFQTDAMHVTRDWSQLVAGSDCPVRLVHGVHDPVVRIDSVRDFARRLNGRCRLVECDDAGQLLMFSKPRTVFEQLCDLFDYAAPLYPQA